MRYAIIPKADYVSEPIEANDSNEALLDFAWTFDDDLNTYFKAIPYCGGTSINPLIENIIEIAWCDADLVHRNMYEDDADSWEQKMAVIDLARQFEKENAGRDWDMKGDYYDAIYEFAERELLKRFGRSAR